MTAPDGGPKGLRVWTDGCYDMVHFGHANQIRQAKQFGKTLVVGVHTDAEIAMHKGPPVFHEEERYRMVRGIKWVDEVVEAAPYQTTVETLNRMDCDFCVHGDDITLTADGHDTYEEVKNAKRYRECKRTPGISTTDLVGRMLLLTKLHHVNDEVFNESEGTNRERARTLSTVRANSLTSDVCCDSPSVEFGCTDGSYGSSGGSDSEFTPNSESCSPAEHSAQDHVAQSPWTRVSRFMPTTQAITDFAEGRPPKPTDKIVYVCGGFDLFHIGHLCFLEEAAKLGDYLIVGLFGDQVVNEYKGGNFPIMSLHERVLSVLAYKPVNQVVIGAPWIISDDIIDSFNISIIAQGTRVPCHHHEGPDPYEAAKKRGIYREVDSGSDMTTDRVIERIIKNRLEYEARNIKKDKKELAAFEALKKLQGDTTKAVSIEKQ